MWLCDQDGKGVKMFNSKTHYHISVIGSIVASPVVIQDSVVAMVEYDKMVEYVRQQLGEDAQRSNGNETRFFDGTIVRKKKCHGNCLA